MPDDNDDDTVIRIWRELDFPDVFEPHALKFIALARLVISHGYVPQLRAVIQAARAAG